MNRYYASPKGYGAYPPGPSTFSISPNRYVRERTRIVASWAAADYDYTSRSSKSEKAAD